MKRIQAKLEESDEEGLIIALNWEKAFDRVSSDYLHNATKALGFGPNIRGWIRTVYDHEAPPLVRVHPYRWNQK